MKKSKNKKTNGNEGKITKIIQIIMSIFFQLILSLIYMGTFIGEPD